MSIKVTVPNNSGDYLTFGSANTPTSAQIGGYDDGSSNGHLEFYTTASGTSTEQMRITSAGNVGIGQTAPTFKLDIYKATLPQLRLTNSASGVGATDGYSMELSSSDAYLWNYETGFLAFGTANTERMRIDSSGRILFGVTSSPSGSVGGSSFESSSANRMILRLASTSTATGTEVAQFINPNGQVGYIGTNATTTSYATSSDYRLKENVAPMTGALAKVSALKPCTYTWKADGSAGEGFIAHELAEVCPDAVTGEKDAVNEDGSIKPQGIDTSFLVATLTAALQELKAELDTVKTELATLKGQA